MQILLWGGLQTRENCSHFGKCSDGDTRQGPAWFFFVCLFFLLIINREQNTSFGGNAEMGLLSEKEDSSPGVQ